MGCQRRLGGVKTLIGVLVLLTVIGWTAAAAGKAEKATASGPTSLTYWCGINSNAAASAKDYNDLPFYQELERVTGVKVDYLHPPVGQGGEQFNLMVASGDLPDIISRDWVSYPGGPLKAIADGVIVDHTDLIRDHAPNLTKHLRSYPMTDKMVRTDTGQYYTFPAVSEDPTQLTYYGLMLRADWLKELGLQVPQTMDDWYRVLTELKTRKAIPYPLTMIDGAEAFATDIFVSAYRITWDFYVEGGKIQYGPVQPAARQFLATFAKWFAEDLLDKDFAAQDGDTFDAKITGDQAGSWPGYSGGSIKRYLGLMATKNPAFDIVGAPYPVLTRGERPFSGQRDNPYNPSYSASITPKCKVPAEAARWMDYSYSDEGQLLSSFGILGVSYTMVDGVPTYTDLVRKNPDGLSMGQAMAKWARSSYGGPFVGDSRATQQYMTLPQQIAAIRTWSATDAAEHRMPPVTLTPEEGDRYANIINQVTTFRDEWLLRFVMGQEPISSFDAYVAEIKKMGIDEAVAMQQAALDRFNRR